MPCVVLYCITNSQHFNGNQCQRIIEENTRGSSKTVIQIIVLIYKW